MTPKNKKPLFVYATLLCMALAIHAPASHAERADRDKPMHLEADQANIDDARHISTFEGNVQVIKGTMVIRGDKIVVTTDSEGFNLGTVTGHPASFRQKREGFDEYVDGYGERIEYDSKNETVDLFVRAYMKRGQDEVRGEHITYSAKTEIYQVHSAQGQPDNASGKERVRAVIQPKGVGAAADAKTESLPIKPATTLTQPESGQ